MTWGVSRIANQREIRFGLGRVKEAGEAVASLGRRCLLATVPVFEAIRPQVEALKESLRTAGLAVAHFNGVVPNPTTESVTAGADDYLNAYEFIETTRDRSMKIHIDF